MFLERIILGRNVCEDTEKFPHALSDRSRWATSLPGKDEAPEGVIVKGDI